MTTLIKNAKLVFPDRVSEGWLLVDGSVIRKTGLEGEMMPSSEAVVDARGNYLSPGFIDMHVHGGGGHDFMDGTEEAFKGACLAHLEHGTTSICPTTLTCPNEELFSFFELYRRLKKEWDRGPNLLGVHLEGPFFSSAQAGAQDPRFLKVPSEAEYLPILEAGGSDIARMSVAVELDGACSLGKELVRRNIIAAIGHSDATYDEVGKAVDSGYSLVTHLYSGMSSLHRVGPYRVLGVVESSYLLDELDVEIIADGKHLPPELLKLIVKLKDNDSISLITDSMRGAGLPEGTVVKLGSLANGQDCIIEDGVAIMPDHKAFAGSVSTTDRLVRTMYRKAGLPLWKAVRMMTRNPARVLGVDDHKGVLAEGYDADLLIFNDNIEVCFVMVNGICRDI